MAILIEVAPGELIDKLTILEIKKANISDPAKLRNVSHEYDVLARVLTEQVPASDTLTDLTAQLKAINESLWKIEDDIRDLERARQPEVCRLVLPSAIDAGRRPRRHRR